MRRDAADNLAASGIEPAQAQAAGVYAVDDASTLHPRWASAPALVFPYHDVSGAPLTWGDDDAPFLRIRYLRPTPLPGRSFLKPRLQRYTQAPGSPVAAYLPKGVRYDWAEIAEDATVPVLITEGEKKALRACLAGAPTIGLGGVWNWRNSTGPGLCAGLDAFRWTNRCVYVCFDSDAATNPDIQLALARLSAELGQRHRAQLHVVMLPPGADGGKQGLDDYIMAQGEDAFFRLLHRAEALDVVEKSVLALNEHVAWIERDGAVYALDGGFFLKKDSFVKGSRFSTLFVQRRSKRGDGLVNVSVAEAWLTHRLAQRYADVTLDPSTEERVVMRNEGACLNLWSGWGETRRDATMEKLFMSLTRHITSTLEPDLQDFPLKLMAWKFQNPASKPAIALVCTGAQGAGKSLWAACIRAAAGQHGVAASTAAMASEYNGWMEKALIAVWDEANAKVAKGFSDKLRAYISERRIYLSEKYRVARQVDNYTTFIFTSNQSGAGAGAYDDRRLFVWNAPRERKSAKFYRFVGEALEQGGGEAVRHFLLHYDLGGWTPPAVAPATQAKAQASYESRTAAELVADEMRTAQEHTVIRWIDAAAAWADAARALPGASMQASDVAASLAHMPIRPWYTAEELAILFPALARTLTGAAGVVSPQALSRELRDAGVPALRSADDPRGFQWRGAWRQFLIVADIEEWVGVALTQAEFERRMAQCATYAAIKRDRIDKAVKKG